MFEYLSTYLVRSKILQSTHVHPAFTSACVVFTLNRSFSPTTSVHPVSVLILHPREIQNLWSQTETEKTKTSINQGKASEMLLIASVVTGTRTQQNKPDQKIRKIRTKETKNPRGVQCARSARLQEEQHTRAEEEHITAVRTKHHEDTGKG